LNELNILILGAEIGDFGDFSDVEVSATAPASSESLKSPKNKNKNKKCQLLKTKTVLYHLTVVT